METLTRQRGGVAASYDAASDGCSATCTVEEGFTCTGEPSVCTEGIDGAALYATNCAGCHATDGSGGIGPDVRGTTATAIQTAIDTNAGGMGSAALQALTQEEIQAIADRPLNFSISCGDSGKDRQRSFPCCCLVPIVSQHA